MVQEVWFRRRPGRDDAQTCKQMTRSITCRDSLSYGASPDRKSWRLLRGGLHPNRANVLDVDVTIAESLLHLSAYPTVFLTDIRDHVDGSPDKTYFSLERRGRIRVVVAWKGRLNDVELADGVLTDWIQRVDFADQDRCCLFAFDPNAIPLTTPGMN